LVLVLARGSILLSTIVFNDKRVVISVRMSIALLLLHLLDGSVVAAV
jgi:hypothetical protein